MSGHEIAAIDIVERAKHETLSVSVQVRTGARPVVWLCEGIRPRAAKRQGSESSLSKSEDTDREGGSGAHASFLPLTCRSLFAGAAAWVMFDFRQKAKGQVGERTIPRAKGPVFFWIGSSAIRAFGGCLGSKRR